MVLRRIRETPKAQSMRHPTTKMHRCSATRHHCAAPIYKHSFYAGFRTTLQRFNARQRLLTEL
jgi:hypothetical protein